MRILLSMLVLLAITSCVSAPPPRATAPEHFVSQPPVAALPPPVPLASDWRDWPQTPGDWRYQAMQGGSVATFGDGQHGSLALQCDRPGRRVVIIDYVPTGGSVTIRTTNLSRVLSFAIGGDPPGRSVSIALAANDPLLDAIGFSRGRFVVEEPGRPPLVLPAWAEVERVVEDCRG